MQNDNLREFVLVNKKEEAENITSLFFTPTDGLKFDFLPGQFVKVKFPSVSEKRKSYTISSIPSEKYVCITIKKKGLISSAMCDLALGEKLIFDGPNGNFFPENDNKDIVMIAGGIGVTPFFSIIKNNLEAKSNKKITLLHSNKTIVEAPFFETLNILAKNNLQFNIINILTQEKEKSDDIQEYSRIDRGMIEKYARMVNKKHYYICGPVQFTADIWKMLKELGIEESVIFTETFY